MTQRQVIPYAEARRRARTASAPRSWREVAAAFKGEVWPEFEPSFRIRPGEVIFTMGSCFARNIESHLAMLGCRAPMLDFDLPAEEWSGGVHGAMNRFHPPAFRQSLQWTAAIHDRDGVVRWPDCEPLALDCGEGLWLDLDMGPAAPVSQERFTQRRQQIFDIFRSVFDAACLMMTPGLIEAWRDRETGLYLHGAPTHRAALSNPERWELEVLSYEVCRDDLLAAIDVARARNPGLKVLLTTSPVPMASTFTGEDVRTANAYSKSVLRAVCGAVRYERPMVDYFPSYESVTLSFPEGIWKDDRIHVAQGFIGKIVARMLDRYIDGADAADRERQRARMHFLAGQPIEAEACARAALELRSDDVEARLVLGQALAAQGRAAEAEAELSALVRLHPVRPDLRLALARAMAQAGEDRASQAIEQVKAAIELPGAALVDLRLCADLVRRRADPETAEALARRMIELFPLHVESRELLAHVLSDQRRWPEVIALLQQALQLRRAPVDMRVQLAGVLRKVGRMQEAQAELERALRMDPDHPKARALQARMIAEPTA